MGGWGGWELGSDGRSPRRTVQDRMTGHDVRLTDEQVALVRRLQRGQFGDASFDPYEVGGYGWPWGRGTCRDLATACARLPSRPWTSSVGTS